MELNSARPVDRHVTTTESPTITPPGTQVIQGTETPTKVTFSKKNVPQWHNVYPPFHANQKCPVFAQVEKV